MNYDERITIRLTKELKEKIEFICSKENINTRFFLEQATKNYFNKHNTQLIEFKLEEVRKNIKKLKKKEKGI